MKLRLVLGALVSTAALVSAIYVSGGSIAVVPTVVALALAAIAPLGAGVAGLGFKGLSSAFKAVFSGDEGTESAEELRAAKAAFVLLIRATLAVMAMGFILINIMMMYDLRDPSEIGSMLSYSLVPALAGCMMIACLYLPLMHALDRKYRSEARGSDDSDGRQGATEAAATRRTAAARLAGGGLISLATIGAIYFLGWGGRLFPLTNIPSVIVMAFLPLGNAIAGPGLGGLAASFKAIGSNGAGGGSSCALRYAKGAFAFMTRSLLASGGIAFLTGVVFYFDGLGDRKRYGPTMALALVGLFYAVLLPLCLSLPLEAAAERRLLLAGGEAHAAD